MSNEVNQKEFAALRGVKPPLVTRWKQRGLLVMSADGERVLVAESMAKLDATLHPGRGGDRTGKPATPVVVVDRVPIDPIDDRASYVVNASREKLARAQLAELELAERAGKVLDAGAAADAVAKLAGQAKALMLAMPRRLAPALTLATDVAVVERLLGDEMRKACDALAGLTPEQSAEHA